MTQNPPAWQPHSRAGGARPFRPSSSGISNGSSSCRRLLLILVLSVYPLLFSLWVNFVNYDFEIPGHAFVGLKNFTTVISDPNAQSALLLTIILSVINVTLEFLLGLVLALAMVKRFRGRGLVMAILIIPLFISPVIVGQSWALSCSGPSARPTIS
jgi:ABC-type sugar transport systems, permease components